MSFDPKTIALETVDVITGGELINLKKQMVTVSKFISYR